MSEKRHKRDLSFEESRVRYWITRNRGVLTEVALAMSPPVSPQFVQQVAYGRSTALEGHLVETLLKKRGWPGIRRRT